MKVCKTKIDIKREGWSNPLGSMVPEAGNRSERCSPNAIYLLGVAVCCHREFTATARNLHLAMKECGTVFELCLNCLCTVFELC